MAPDLATDMGKHNADFTQWTYTLKSGLKFSNGKAITPMDVKYGVERLFATDVINGGPSSYFIQGIAHPKSYKGPYKSGDLTTITTTGEHHHLQPVRPERRLQLPDGDGGLGPGAVQGRGRRRASRARTTPSTRWRPARS